MRPMSRGHCIIVTTLVANSLTPVMTYGEAETFTKHESVKCELPCLQWLVYVETPLPPAHSPIRPICRADLTAQP